MSENITKTQAFRLKGRLYTFTVLQVLTEDKEEFAQQLAETVTKAPKMFERAAVVLDFSAVLNLEIDLQGFCHIAREHGMVPVAIQGGNSLTDSIAQLQGLAILNGSTSQDKTIIEQPIAQTPIVETTKAKLITVPVRSGQQVVAKGSDLIVSSSVSRGAELLADGNIHVYGALRGRALAGISGYLEARIYCQSLEAELLSIAGYYRLSDAFDPVNKPCQIYLVDEHIVIEPL